MKINIIVLNVCRGELKIGGAKYLPPEIEKVCGRKIFRPYKPPDTTQ